jgi:hypothetical protein
MLTVGGLVGFGITTVLAMRQTAKSEPVLKRVQADIDDVKTAVYEDEKDRQRQLVRVYVKASLSLAEHYWPVLAMGAASSVAIIAGHKMMLKRQASLVAAYSLLDAAFKAYRRKVAEVVGDEEEKQLYRRKVVDGLDRGYTLEDCERIAPEDDVMPSVYSRFFDDSSPNWKKTPEYNLFFLRCQQQWANDRLQAFGFIFLNEVLEALGLPRSQIGQMVGWKLGHPGSDDFVDFGMYDIGDECNRAFVNGHEHTVLLDFNCVPIVI